MPSLISRIAPAMILVTAMGAMFKMMNAKVGHSSSKKRLPVQNQVKTENAAVVKPRFFHDDYSETMHDILQQTGYADKLSDAFRTRISILRGE
jgi:hypothetical protein